MRTWVRIRSWHLFAYTARGGYPVTLCGKPAKVGAETSETMPEGRTCEGCFRTRAAREV